MSVTQPKYNPLGGLIRALLAARGLKAFELAEKVGISKQSISKIMTGLKRPRQTTFTKICEVLVSTPEEERALVQAYLNSKALKKDRAAPLNPAMEAATLRRRAEQFLAQKPNPSNLSAASPTNFKKQASPTNKTTARGTTPPIF